MKNLFTLLILCTTFFATMPAFADLADGQAFNSSDIRENDRAVEEAKSRGRYYEEAGRCS